MAHLDTIGKRSTLHEEDAEWLIRLARDYLEDEGLHAKAIYLRQLVKHATEKGENDEQSVS